MAADLLAETVRQQRLVDDLLALARADEAGAGPPATIDLDDLMFAEARRIRGHAGITVDPDASAPAGSSVTRPAVTDAA
jgi:signal transduction histidine kinase